MLAREQQVAFEQSEATGEQSMRCLLAAFAYLGVPRLMLDVGCGPGHLVRTARSLGAYASGVDLGVRHEAQGAFGQPGDGYLWPLDLTQPWPEREVRCYDLVLCWEVAEHLPAGAADVLCDTLASLVADDGVLLFSAATPGQGGAGHLNEQPHEYWSEKLAERGLLVDDALTPRLRRAFSEVAPAAWWYGQNVMALRRPA